MFEHKEWESIFKERLETYFDELKWLYCELYGEYAFDEFLEMLYAYYQSRSAVLKDWDKKRTRTKDGVWYKSSKLLGMCLYVDQFADNLKGVESHMDYLQECGVNYLHLMPLLDTPEGASDGGYAVSDFRKVRPDLGTMEDLAALAQLCHDQGMYVCLDFVMNHTSRDHEWAQRARNGEGEYMGRYFFYDDWTIPNQFEYTMPQVFPTTAPGNFSWCEELSKVVMTTFYPYQWDLNYANPVVFREMTANMLNLCNHGIDVLRLDAVPYIWKQLGTNCRNLPQVHNLTRMLHIAVDVVCPGTLLLGEVVMEPDKVVPYFGTLEKPQCHMLYNVTTMATTWHTVATRDTRLMKHQLGKTFALSHQFTFLNYLRCHDDIGWGLDYGFLGQFGQSEVTHKKYLNDYLTGNWGGSDARGELYNDDPRLGDARLCGTTASLCGIEAAEYELDEEKLDWTIRFDLMLHAFLLTQSGIPVLYSGDEIGQLNDYTYHHDPHKWADSRYIHRGKFSWEDAEKRKKKGTRQNRIFTMLRRLEKIRGRYKAFHPYADTWVIETGDDRVLGIGRYYEGAKLIALFNFSDEPITVGTGVEESDAYLNLLNMKKEDGRTVTVPSRDFKWLYHKFK